jgi:hypothetical protein
MTNLRLGLLLVGLGSLLAQAASAQESAPNPSAPANQGGVTKEEIKKFLNAQISEDAIISYIRKHPPYPPICCDDLTDLKRSGASDDLIKALIEAETPPGQQPQYAPPAYSDSGAEGYPDSSYYYSYPSTSYPYPYYSYPPPTVFFFHDDHRFDHDHRSEHFRHPERDEHSGAHPQTTPRPQPSRPPSQGATPHGEPLPREGHHQERSVLIPKPAKRFGRGPGLRTAENQDPERRGAGLTVGAA